MISDQTWHIYIENEAEAKCGDGQPPSPEEVISICQTQPLICEDAKEPTQVEESNLSTSSDGVQKKKCEVEDDVSIEKAVIVEKTVTEEGDRGKLFVNIFKSVQDWCSEQKAETGEVEKATPLILKIRGFELLDWGRQNSECPDYWTYPVPKCTKFGREKMY